MNFGWNSETMENGNAIRWIHLPKVDSTNSYLRQMADDDTSDITVAYTDDQYAGRGQKGNSWECEPGKNLSFSILLHPLFVKPAEQFIISQAMALAVVNVLNGLDDTGKKRFTVKWPNDIYYDDWKISGTLIECDLQGKHIANCIIGTGLNVNQQEFLSDAPNPTSLIRIFGHEFNREQLLHSIVDDFCRRYAMIEDGQADAIRAAYRSLLYRRQGLHPYKDASGPFMAEIQDIEPSGHLILRTADGQIRRYEFKEVKFLID